MAKQGNFTASTSGKKNRTAFFAVRYRWLNVL
ncbi:hypothetical protein SAMN04488128_103591 [Chitinophaga eiseniae]|uniref:Uncharacterized protein n=1 Tax=Chitinophaga eiseniae TaxID=634771 RepID=A0A1T4SV28_9BACT|nr:hypothetical protein SAMN04488128_103591 [Chitinophaga eiseniae]